MTIKNENPDGTPMRLEEGTELVSARRAPLSDHQDGYGPPGAQEGGRGRRHDGDGQRGRGLGRGASSKGNASVVGEPAQFRSPASVAGAATTSTASPSTSPREKQEYWGDDKSYLFDPVTESYERVDNLNLARWYPTLVGLEDGRVLSVSGLDEFGRIIDGHNEIYDPETSSWSAHPELRRTFPTYPSLFLMPSGKLFYTGSNAGYGSDTVGRDPGIWDLSDNSFDKVPGLREPRQTETSGSVLLPPAQDQRYMIAGGGGIGESPKSTARTDVIDLDEAGSALQAGPGPGRAGALPEHGDHAGRQGRDHRRARAATGVRATATCCVCQLYDPKNGSMSRMADPTVGRNYHSEALLLPDGRLITLGSDPLYGDADNTIPGTFERGSRSTRRPTSTRASGRESRAARRASAAARPRASAAPTRPRSERPG